MPGVIRLPARAAVRPRHQRGEMNRLEARYAEYLEARRLAGEIHQWWFEALTLKLADDCRYTADFLVQLPDGTLELHETKGHWRDDAKVKVRLAAKLFPFRIVAARWSKRGGWTWEEF